MRTPDKNRTLRILRDRGIPVETVLDVGVLYGTPELMKAYPDKFHVLFEPVQEFNASIKDKYAHIPHKLENIALSDRDGETRLEMRSIVPGMKVSHSTITTNDVVEDGKTYRTVPVSTIDNYLAKNPQPGPYFFKLDVDGFEMNILRGATETLKNSSIVMVEASKRHLIERVSYVANAGFELYDLAEPCYYDQSFWQCDAIFVRRDLQHKHFAQLGTDYDPKKYQKFADAE